MEKGITLGNNATSFMRIEPLPSMHTFHAIKFLFKHVAFYKHVYWSNNKATLLGGDNQQCDCILSCKITTHT